MSKDRKKLRNVALLASFVSMGISETNAPKKFKKARVSTNKNGKKFRM